MSSGLEEIPTEPQMFTGQPQHELFSRLGELFPTREMNPARDTFVFAEGERIELPAEYTFNGEPRNTEAFITDTDTSALFVLKDGAVRYERYWLTGGRDVRWISWSVAKSFVSALIGIAVDEGAIRSIDDPIAAYVPALVGSAYDGVSIKQVLQMSSGAQWSEEYSNPEAEIHGLSAAMAGERSLASFVSSIKRAYEPGTLCQYNSADTQALGMLLVAATGQSISAYMEDRLCEPLGFESGGYWVLDSAGMEMAFAGVNLTARDFAKIGELFRNEGRWNGRQIISADWVARSVTPDAPHVQPGNVVVGTHRFPFGYGYQWWIPQGSRGEFSAIGVYNQFVYVDPKPGVVIVKLSANRAYGTTSNEAENREIETLEFLRAIARQFDRD